MPLHSVTLASQTDLAGFRREARALLATLVPPEEAQWHAPAETATLRSDQPREPGSRSGGNPFLPRAFMTLCELVILHNDPARFGLLYRLLWRLVHEPGLRRDPQDDDRVRAVHMAQAVRRDVQKMKARVRFETFDTDIAGGPLHIACFEPEHYILEAIAPFFARRFTPLHWAILTPACSVRWNREALEFGPGIRRAPNARVDAREAPWLARYRQVFVHAALQQKPPGTPIVQEHPAHNVP